jgi:uncharacterized OsmC-like protein
MDADALRQTQAPLKQGYRDAPESARIPARAEAVIDQEGVAAKLGNTIAGLHPAAGGDGSQACSADMLLEALAACAGVTLAAVATASGVKLRHGRVIATGIWDARGTLGIDKSAPVGLTEINLTFDLDTDADDATEARLLALTERYCVIFQTLRIPPKLSVARKQMAGATAGATA